MKKYILTLLLFFLVRPGQAQPFHHDYSKTWVTKMFLAEPDQKGGSNVWITFEKALEFIKKTDEMSLGVPKIIYLVGWQYNGHDDKYPAFFEVNRHLKRASDATAEESLGWLIREARKYNTTVSLHINMTDAYDNSPLWDEYVENDLISKNRDGSLKIIGEYNNMKAYQINYKNEWNKGYTQMRIDRLLETVPELQGTRTIHSDAWIARASEGHNESLVVETEYQKKAALYWRAKGMDITSEWYMDYMTGYVPLVWHFNGFRQDDYLAVPASVYTGVGLNPDIRSDKGVGFLFGTSSYGEPFWTDKANINTDKWEKALTNDFMLKCPQYFFLNRFDRMEVTGEGDERVAWYSDGVKVSLADSLVTHGDQILRKKNTVCFPAVWREDKGVIVYTADDIKKGTFDVPYSWGKAKSAILYRITMEGPEKIRTVKVKDFTVSLEVENETPYYLVPLAD